MTRARDYREDLLVALRDPSEARDYLNAALEDGNQDVFLLALRDVVDANLGMTQLANTTGRSRPSLYKTLSEQGQPEWVTVQAILESIGFRLQVETDSPQPVLSESLSSPTVD